MAANRLTEFVPDPARELLGRETRLGQVDSDDSERSTMQADEDGRPPRAPRRQGDSRNSLLKLDLEQPERLEVARVKRSGRHVAALRPDTAYTMLRPRSRQTQLSPAPSQANGAYCDQPLRLIPVRNGRDRYRRSRNPIARLTSPRAARSARVIGSRSRWYSAYGRGSAPNASLNLARPVEAPVSPMW